MVFVFKKFKILIPETNCINSLHLHTAGSTYNAAPTDAYDPYYDNFEDPINYYDDNPYPDYDPHYDYDTFDYPEEIYSNAPEVYGTAVTEEYLGIILISEKSGYAPRGL